MLCRGSNAGIMNGADARFTSWPGRCYSARGSPRTCVRALLTGVEPTSWAATRATTSQLAHASDHPPLSSAVLCISTRNVQPRAVPLSRREVLLAQLAVAGLVGGAGQQAQAAAFVDDAISTSVFRAGAPSVASIAIVRSKAGVPTREPIGSGIVWDSAGPHMLTNFHIIPPLNGTNVVLEVTVTDAANGTVTTLGARVAGTDSIHDLAVLQLLPRAAGAPGEAVAGEVAAAGPDAATAPMPALAPIRLGTSADLRVGQAVYALGCVPSTSSSPQTPALTTTMSAGLISGLQRSIPSPVGARIYGMLQTDAVINAANSGGPLLDSAGRLVGLNTAVGRSQTVSARGSGVGFALPADLLADVVPKVILYGNPYGKK